MVRQHQAAAAVGLPPNAGGAHALGDSMHNTVPTTRKTSSIRILFHGSIPCLLETCTHPTRPTAGAPLHPTCVLTNYATCDIELTFV